MTWRHIVALIGCVLLPLAASAHGACVFSSQPLDGSRFAHDAQVASYTVFSESRQIKGVLASGELFALKSWSCNHAGWRGNLIMTGWEASKRPDLHDAFMRLGRLMLDKADRQLLDKALQAHPIDMDDLPVTRQIPDTGYDEFVIKAARSGMMTLISIEYYQS